MLITDARHTSAGSGIVPVKSRKTPANLQRLTRKRHRTALPDARNIRMKAENETPLKAVWRGIWVAE
jgi:hypothetical protein